jgi:hypothetical protein
MSGVNRRAFAATSVFLMDRARDGMPNQTRGPPSPTHHMKNYSCHGYVDRGARVTQRKQSEPSNSNYNNNNSNYNNNSNSFVGGGKGESRIFRSLLIRFILGGSWVWMIRLSIGFTRRGRPPVRRV